MDIWYTPERMALHQEIDQRRMARYERRAKEAKRRQMCEDALELLKIAVGIVLGVIGLFCWMILATI